MVISTALFEGGFDAYLYWLYKATADLDGNGRISEAEEKKAFKRLGITGAQKKCIEKTEKEIEKQSKKK